MIKFFISNILLLSVHLATAQKPKLDSAISYLHKEEQWILDQKGIYTYTDNEEVLSIFSLKWNEVEYKWDSVYWQTYVYDLDNLNTQILSFDWNKIEDKWIETRKITRIYNENKAIELERWFFGDNSETELIEQHRNYYTYNSDGTLSERDSKSYNFITSQWVNSYKYVYSYDVNKNQTSQFVYSWNQDSKVWEEYEETSYTYNANGILTGEVRIKFNMINGWTNYSKIEYVLNNDDDKADIIYYNWDSEKQVWSGYRKSENQFDVSYTYLDVITPFDSFYKHRLVSEIDYSWDSKSGEYIVSQKGYLYYSGLNTTGFKNQESLSFKIYPNPAVEFLTIEIKDFSNWHMEIFNSLGCKVMEGDYFGNSVIPVQKLTPGIYYIKVKVFDTYKVTPLIIE